MRKYSVLHVCYFLFLAIACFSSTTTTTTVAAALYDDTPEVHVMTSLEQFDTAILPSQNLWMVQFCDAVQESCQKMAQAYAILAKLFRHVLQFAFVDVETDGGRDIVQRHRIQTTRMPALYWFLDDKNQPTLIESLEGSMEAIIGHSMSTIAQTVANRAKELGIAIEMEPDDKQQQQQQQRQNQQQQQKKSGGKSSGSKTVHVKGDEEFDEKVLSNPLVTMVAFTAPWCGHCKMLQPEWDEAADKLDGQGAQLVWIDATDPTNEQLAAMYQVKGFPTIYIFPGGAPKTQSSSRLYPGERKAQAMVKYVLEQVDRTGTPKEIPQLTSPELLQEECKGHNHICVLAALPHIIDSGATGRNQYRDLLAKVSKTFRGGAFSFLWFEGGSQPALEEALELTFGYPALVAYSMDRHAFAVLHGSFSEKSMTSFLHGVTSGRVSVKKMTKEKVPKIEPTEPWDGQDAAPPEEEFDLADIMGWDDEEEGAQDATPEEGSAPNDEL